MKQITKCFVLFFLFVFSFSKGIAQSVGGITTGAATYCATINSGFVTVSGYTGTISNWQSSTNGGVTWNNIASTNANQTYFNLAQTTCYHAIVQNGGFPPDTSTAVCITIYPSSIGGTISGGGTFCSGSGPGTLTLWGSTGNVLYWQYSINNGIGWTNISNTTSTENYLNIITNTLYRAIVQNGSTCPTDTSTEVSFTIDPTTATGTISGAANVCVTGNNGVLNLSGNNGNILGWSLSADSGASWLSIPNTTALQPYLNLASTTLYHAIIQSGNCAADSTEDVIISVSPATVAGTISGGGIFCGSPANGTLTLSGYTGSIIEWVSSTTNGSGWMPVLNTTSSENYTALSVTTWYTTIVQSGGCPADTANVEIISVAPSTIAGAVTGNATVCYGTNQDTLKLTGNTGTVLSWILSTDNGINWASVPGTTPFYVYNGAMTTTLYAAIVQSGACSIDTANNAVVTVLPPFIVFAGNDTAITSGQSISLNGSGQGTPLWTPSSTLNNAAVFSPTATPTGATTYVLTVTDTNGCQFSDTIAVLVNQHEFTGMVSNLFTPNGDGINDNWYIEGIANFPENEVFVYTIYGNEVFRKKAYTNDWQGTFKGSELPDGTYFYVVRLDNNNKIVKGSLDILRSK